jgi:hypothetical protein
MLISQAIRARTNTDLSPLLSLRPQGVRRDSVTVPVPVRTYGGGPSSNARCLTTAPDYAPQHLRPARYPSWRARHGSSDSRMWRSLGQVEGRSRRYRRERVVGLGDGRRSTYTGRDPDATGAELLAERTSSLGVDDRAADSVPQATLDLKGRKSRSCYLATENGKLMAEHDDLNGQFFVVMAGKAEQFQESDKGNEEKRQGHGPVSSQESTHESSVQGSG